MRQRCEHALLLILVFSTLGFLASPPLLFAQETPTVRTSPQQQTEPAGNAPAPPGGSKTKRYTLSHERYAKAIAYSRANYALYFLSVFISLVALILALRFRVVARIRDYAQRKTENHFLQGLVFIPLLVFLIRLADLPVWLTRHWLSLHYEQSIQPWGSWFADVGKAELIDIAFFTLMGLILLLIIRKSPRRWWFYFWLAALPIILAILVLEPVIIDPLFFKFQPLAVQHPGLATDIQKLTERAGLQIPRERMFVMNASSKTNAINAYVVGFGASKRVIIYDNVIQKMTPEEALFIFGHEAGHYVLNHIRNGFVFFAMVLLITLYAAYRLLHAILARWGTRWKLYGPQDWGALAVLMLLLEGIAFFSSPVINGYSRIQEHRADIFGLELIHPVVPNSSQVAAHAFQAMGEIDLADPNPPPFITFWIYSHPPVAERLVFAHTYDPWGKNQPPKYVREQKR